MATSIDSTFIVLAGTPLDVRVASALQSSAGALGYEGGAHIQLLDEVSDLKSFVFEADPWSVVAVDDVSIEALREAFALDEKQFAPDKPVTVTGYRLVAVPAFAECLDDQDAKRIAWCRMKAAAHPGNPLD